MINIPDWIWFLILLFSIGLTLGSYLEIVINHDESCIKWFILGVLLFAISIVCNIYELRKDQELIKENYTYKIIIPKGRTYDEYYTNEYKVENGVIYFEGGCADNFTIIKIK